MYIIWTLILTCHPFFEVAKCSGQDFTVLSVVCHEKPGRKELLPWQSCHCCPQPGPPEDALLYPSGQMRIPTPSPFLHTCTSHRLFLTQTPWGPTHEFARSFPGKKWDKRNSFEPHTPTIKEAGFAKRRLGLMTWAAKASPGELGVDPPRIVPEVSYHSNGE